MAQKVEKYFWLLLKENFPPEALKIAQSDHTASTIKLY